VVGQADSRQQEHSSRSTAAAAVVVLRQRPHPVPFCAPPLQGRLLSPPSWAWVSGRVLLVISIVILFSSPIRHGMEVAGAAVVGGEDRAEEAMVALVARRRRK